MFLRMLNIGFAGLALVNAASIPITVHSTPPKDASIVPADFVGFGFASPNVPDYANPFSKNLIDAVAQRMTAKPIIRAGGTSGDHIIFDKNQKEAVKCQDGSNCPYSVSGKYTVGPTYFDAFKYFNTPMTFQAPFAQPLNIPNAVAYVSHAYKALGKGHTAAIALGNEVASPPDKIPTPQKYVDEVESLEKAIIAELKLDKSAEKIFEVLDLANGNSLSGDPWTLAQAFKAGLNKNGRVRFAAEHYYQVTDEDSITFSPEKLQAQIMNHGAIKTHFKPYLSAIRSLDGKVPFILSETGSSLSGNLTFNNALGACLWSVDFQLYSMSNGVARVDGSQRPTEEHSLWNPIAETGSNLKPTVRATFYAQPFIADFIHGKTTRVVEHQLSSDLMSAYIMYDGQTPKRVALVNLKFWDKSKGARGDQTFTISGLSASNVTVKTLTARAGATALGYDIGGNAENITWAGEQWSYKIDHGKGHKVDQISESVRVSHGNATIVVKDSSAVIVSF